MMSLNKYKEKTRNKETRILLKDTKTRLEEFLCVYNDAKKRNTYLSYESSICHS